MKLQSINRAPMKTLPSYCIYVMDDSH